MKRREVIQTLSASLGAMLVLPAWAEGWTKESLGSRIGLLTADQLTLLTEVVSTFIPEGQILGAKSLGVPAFVEKMIADCYEKPIQDKFRSGLDAIEARAKAAHNQSFAVLPQADKVALLTAFSQTTDASQKEFYGLLKNLTMQGYTTSEYVMINHLKYQMAPGHYYGCVSV